MRKIEPKPDIQKQHLILGSTVLLLVIALCYAEVLFHMVRHWSLDPNYSHGFLIPIVSGFIIWKERDKFSVKAVRPNLWGFLILVFGLCLLIIGKAGSVTFMMRLSLLIVLLGSLLSVVGTELTKTLLFPVGYLMFMIPLPAVLYNDLTFRLRILASAFSTKILTFLGIPVFREGNIIQLSQTSLQVVDACSGLRSLVSLLALSILVGYVTRQSNWKILTLVVLSVPIAIISNVFRLTITGIIAHKYGSELAQGFFHTYSGLVVFGIAFALLFFCAVILKRVGRRQEPGVGTSE